MRLVGVIAGGDISGGGESPGGQSLRTHFLHAYVHTRLVQNVAFQQIRGLPRDGPFLGFLSFLTF